MIEPHEVFPGAWFGARKLNHCIKWINANHVETQGGQLLLIRSLRGIPLTPEILRDWFGFQEAEVDQTDSHMQKRWEVPDWEDSEIYAPSLSIAFMGNPFAEYWLFSHNQRQNSKEKYAWVSEIEYVHQLQRLYHALTLQPLKRIDL